MTIIINNGSLINYENVAFINMEVKSQAFGECQCNIFTLTVYLADSTKILVAEEANRVITDNVLEQVSDAISSGEAIVDLRKMGLTDGDKLSSLKKELVEAYRMLERPLLRVDEVESFIQTIQEKKEAIADLFRMPKENAMEFLESDEGFISPKLESVKQFRKNMQLYARERQVGSGKYNRCNNQ